MVGATTTPSFFCCAPLGTQRIVTDFRMAPLTLTVNTFYAFRREEGRGNLAGQDGGRKTTWTILYPSNTAQSAEAGHGMKEDISRACDNKQLAAQTIVTLRLAEFFHLLGSALLAPRGTARSTSQRRPASLYQPPAGVAISKHQYYLMLPLHVAGGTEWHVACPLALSCDGGGRVARLSSKRISIWLVLSRRRACGGWFAISGLTYSPGLLPASQTS